MEDLLEQHHVALRHCLEEVPCDGFATLAEAAPDLQALKRIRLVLEMGAATFDRHRSLFAGSLA